MPIRQVISGTLFAFICFGTLSALAAPLEGHKAEVAEISKKTSKFERRIAELQKRKMQAREGEELENVLSEIGDVHKELLGLRRDRTILKQHLLLEHPESNLIYDASLHKTFDKKTSDQKNPLDERLDELLALMQSQYAKYLPAKTKPEAAPVAAPATAPKVEAPKADEKAPSATAEVKEKYLHEQIKSEMKVGPPPASAKKDTQKSKEGPKDEEAVPAHKEKPKTSGHH